MRSKWFLIASLISSIGDFILIFSLPNGVVKETNFISIAPIFWLIPAVMMYMSLVTKKYFINREKKLKSDYCLLLFSVIACELLTALIIFKNHSSNIIVTISIIFVFFYAFLKEGIPRLIFNNKIYNLFCEEKDILRLSGQKGSVDLVGSIIGIYISSYFMSDGLWKYAFLIDAITFVFFVFIIIIVGKDACFKNVNTITVAPCSLFLAEKRTPIVTNIEKSLKYVLFSVPLIYFINSLYQNYISIINNELNILPFSYSIMLISILRFPSILLGAFIDRLSRKFYWDKVLLIFPIVYVFFSILFLCIPNIITMSITVLLSGFFVGIFLPITLNLINCLQYQSMLDFNAILLKNIAISQSVGCTLNMIIYYIYGFSNYHVIALFVAISAIFFYVYFYILSRRFIYFKFHFQH